MCVVWVYVVLQYGCLYSTTERQGNESSVVIHQMELSYCCEFASLSVYVSMHACMHANHYLHAPSRLAQELKASLSALQFCCILYIYTYTCMPASYHVSIPSSLSMQAALFVLAV
jgi:hypothetical protein